MPDPILKPRRILVRGVNWLGDAVMTTPALQRLRERFPDAHITILSQQKLAEMWQRHPSINAVLTFAAGENPWSVARRLRADKHDLAMVLPNSARSALEMWLAGIPQRIGYGRPVRNWFLTNAVPLRPGRIEMHKRSPAEVRRLMDGPTRSSSFPATAHQVHEYLHLVGFLGANEAPLPPLLNVASSEIEAAEAKFSLRTPGSTNRPIFGLNPGAEYGPAKRWPVDRFISAAREIQRRTDCLWLIFGGESDSQTGEQIHSAIRSAKGAIFNLAGQTSLRDLCALLKACRVLLTNDTGPMHLAAALGTPVVVPFGSTSPDLTGPGLPGDPRQRLLKSDVPCSPCFRRTCPIDFRCMNGISVEHVVTAVVAEASVVPR